MARYKVYTKGGDKGRTSLVGGQRIEKASLRLEAYGTTDELNAQLGWLAAQIVGVRPYGFVVRVQHQLFVIGGYLATPSDAESKPCQVKAEHVEAIEHEIDWMDEELPELSAFVIPGGSAQCAAAHVCRTVCRRAERAVLRLGQQELVDPEVVRYLNRLSDYLFVLSRWLIHQCGGEELYWRNDCV